MALKKVIIDDKGIISEYHMISEMQTTDKLNVKIKSYTAESFRNIEKKRESDDIVGKKIMQQHIEEMQKEHPNFELISSLEKQMAELNIEKVDYSVGAHTIVIPFDKTDNLSYENIYQKLKLEPIFAGAEDC